MKEKSLFQLKRLWILILMVLFLSGSVAAHIFLSSDLTYVPGYMGVNGLLEVFKVPLGILALLFPVVALVSASHRSEQTKKQIIISESQNSFANYYKHVEEFEKITLLLEKRFNLEYINHRELYFILFPLNSPSHVKTDSTGIGVRPHSKIYIISKALYDLVDVINHMEDQEAYSSMPVNSFFSVLSSFSKELKFMPKESAECHRVTVEPFLDRRTMMIKENDPFIHYHAFAEYLSILGSFCNVVPEFKRVSDSPEISKLAFRVLDKYKIPFYQDPETGEILTSR
ncbi:hypothetical protein LG331_08015 [Vreelandella aquamarina]|uniref:hypothetical protein n=1 Tax=Vreelandella aquamarina TaxID=77097 RepID=UPI00385067A9